VDVDLKAGTESIHWTNPEIWGNAPEGSDLKLLFPSEAKKVVRSIRPLFSY
jgi:hypothetical protein